MARHWHAQALRLLPLLAFPAFLQARESALATKSTSASGQFVIYSNDPARRTNISQRAEIVRSEWLEKTGGDGNWKNPIIIQDLIGRAKPRGNPNVRTGIYEGDGGTMKVQTDVYDASVLRNDALELELYRALGLETIYRSNPLKSGKVFRPPPQWLIEGLAEEKRASENGTPDGVSTALLKSDRPPRVEEFLKAKPELMEATSLTLYRTQALAFLKVLLQLPEGRKGLGKYVDSLADSDGDVKSLLAAFPSLENNSSKLGKLWTLSIARISTSKGADPLSIGETARSLKELLEISAPLDPRKPALGMVTGPAALSSLARSEGGPYLMRQKSAEFLALEFRAHPLLKPVIQEYRNITTLLASRPKKNVDKQIEENGKILDLLLQRTGKVGDYLNWFEATQLDTLSENFLQVTTPPQAPGRTDPVTQYLDGIENHGW